MEELIALLVLGGLSILLDKLNKKRATTSPAEPSEDDVFEDPMTLPPEIEELLQKEDTPVEKEQETMDVISPEEIIEIPKKISKEKRKEPSLYEPSRLYKRHILSLNLKGNSIRKAVILKEILDEPRGLKPFG